MMRMTMLHLGVHHVMSFISVLFIKRFSQLFMEKRICINSMGWRFETSRMLRTKFLMLMLMLFSLSRHQSTYWLSSRVRFLLSIQHIMPFTSVLSIKRMFELFMKKRNGVNRFWSWLKPCGVIWINPFLSIQHIMSFTSVLTIKRVFELLM